MANIANIKFVLSAAGAERVERQIRSIQSSGRKTASVLMEIHNVLKRMEKNGLVAVQKQMTNTTSATKKLEMQVKKLESANEKLQSQMKKMQTAQVGATTATKRGTAAVEKQGKGIRNLIPHVAAVTISYMAMRRAVRAVMEALKAGAEFEQQMAIVGGIVRATTAEFEMLADAARKAGETTVWTATESANALRFLGMAGFDAAESIVALGGVLNLALIGEMELSRATDIATDTLRAFGLEAGELDRVVDVMVGTITRSNTNIEKMGQAMKFVAPIAAQLGYSVEQVSAMIGVLSQSGIKAGIAGRALRMSFLKSIGAAKELGLESSNLIGILRELESRNMGAAELTSTLKELFGLRSTPAMLVLMRGMEQLDEFTETLENAGGETDKFIERLDTTSVAFRKLASVVKDVAISVFLEYADDLKGGIKDLAQAIKDNKDEIKEFFDSLITYGKLTKDVVVPPLQLLVVTFKALKVAVDAIGGDPFQRIVYLGKGIDKHIQNISDELVGVNALNSALITANKIYNERLVLMADMAEMEDEYDATRESILQKTLAELEESTITKDIVSAFEVLMTTAGKESAWAYMEAFSGGVEASGLIDEEFISKEGEKVHKQILKDYEKLVAAQLAAHKKFLADRKKITETGMKSEYKAIYALELAFAKAMSAIDKKKLEEQEKFLADRKALTETGMLSEYEAVYALELAFVDAMKAIDDKKAEENKRIYKEIKEYINDVTEALEEFRSAAEAAGIAYQTMTKDLGSSSGDWETVQLRIKGAYGEMAAIAKLEAEVADAVGKVIGETEKTEKQYRNDKLQAMKSLYEDLEEISGNYYDAQVQIIDMEYDKYMEMLGLKLSEQKIWNEKDKQLFDALNRWKVLETIKLQQQLLIHSGGFFGGMVAYLMQAQIDWQNAWEQMGQFGYDTFEKIGDGFEDSVVSVLKNDMHSIGDIWEALLDDMLDSFIKLIANLVRQWMMAGLANLVIGITVGGAATTGIGGGAATGEGSGIFGSAVSSIGRALANKLLTAGYDYISGALFGGGYGFSGAGVSGPLGAGTYALPQGAPFTGYTAPWMYQPGSGAYWGGSGMGGMSGLGAGLGGFAGAGTGAGGSIGAMGGGVFGGASGFGTGAAASGGAGSGAAASAAAGPILAAAMLAIMGAFAWQASSQNEPSSLSTRWEGRASQDPEKLFEAELLNVSTYMGAWDDADILSTVNGVILGQVNEAFGTYNAIFRNVGEESQKKLKETFDGFEGLYLYISQMAAPGAPMTAMAGLGKYADWQANLWNDASGSYEPQIDRTIGKEGWSSGLQGTALEAVNEILGSFFEEYIAEAVEGLKGDEMFEFMTDDIQDAIESADLGQFINDIKGFYKSFTENADLIQKAGKVWEELNHWVDGTTKDYTQFDRIAMEAQVQVTAFAAKMAELGNELSEEEITDKLKEIFDRLSEGVDLKGLAAPMTLMDQLIAGINAQFDAYLEMLKEYGVDLEKINDLEEKRAKILERETKALSDATWEQVNATVDQLMQKTLPLEDTIIGVTKAFDNIFKALKDIFGIDDFTEEIGKLKEELKKLTDAFADEVKAFEDMIKDLESGDATAAIKYFTDELERLSKAEGTVGEFAVLFAEIKLAFGSAAGDITSQLQFLYDGMGFVKPGMERVKAAGEAFQTAMRAFTGSMGGMTPEELIAGFGTIKEASEKYREELEKIAVIPDWGSQTASSEWAKRALVWLDWFDTIVGSFEETLMDLTAVGGTDEEIQRVKDILEALTGGGDLSNEALADALKYLEDALADLMASGGASADEIKRLTDDIAALEKATAAYIAMQEKQLLAMKIQMGLFDEEYGRELRMAEIKERYEKTGMSSDELIEWFKNASLDDLKAMAESLGLDWTDIANDIAFLLAALGGLGDGAESAANKIRRAQAELLGGEDMRLWDLSERYGVEHGAWTQKNVDDIRKQFLDSSPEEFAAWAKSLGVSTDQLIADILKLIAAFDDAGMSIEDAAKQIKGIFQGVNDLIAGTGLAEKAARLWGMVIDLAKPFLSPDIGGGGETPTPEELTNISSKIVEWYYASEAAARALGQVELEAAQLQIQVADRISALIDQIDQTIRNIKYSDLNVSLPYQKAEEAQEDYDTLLAAALSGGTEDVNKYLGFAQTYLQQQQADLKSSQAYQDVYASVMGDLETVKGMAEAGGYDAKILEELKKGNSLTVEQTEAYKAAMVTLNAAWDDATKWVQDWVDRLERASAAISIDWGNFDGSIAEVLALLMDIVSLYGWENKLVIDWIFNIPMSIFKDFEDAMKFAGFIASAAGWESKATISFFKNLGENWEFEDMDEVLAAIGWVKEAAGSWTASATIAFIAGLMDASGTPIEDMHYWLTKLGIGDEIPDVLVKLILQTVDFNDIPWDDIDAYLKSLGITDAAIRKSMEVDLVFGFAVSGDMDLAGIGDWVYAKIFSALILDVGDPEKQRILKQVESLAGMFGVFDAYNLGRRMSELSPLAQGAGWTDPTEAGTAAEAMWQQDMGYASWAFAKGGIVDSPTLGMIGEAGYPEAVIPMMDGYNIPVKWLNGGSTGAEGTANRPLHITVEVAGKEFKADVEAWADNVRVTANKTKGNETRRLYR